MYFGINSEALFRRDSYSFKEFVRIHCMNAIFIVSLRGTSVQSLYFVCEDCHRISLTGSY